MTRSTRCTHYLEARTAAVGEGRTVLPWPRTESKMRLMGLAMGQHKNMSTRTMDADAAPTASPYREHTACTRVDE